MGKGRGGDCAGSGGGWGSFFLPEATAPERVARREKGAAGPESGAGRKDKEG